MKTFRAIAGYVLGGMMFVVLLPTIMWLASGMPALEHIGALRAYCKRTGRFLPFPCSASRSTT